MGNSGKSGSLFGVRGAEDIGAQFLTGNSAAGCVRNLPGQQGAGFSAAAGDLVEVLRMDANRGQKGGAALGFVGVGFEVHARQDSETLCDVNSVSLLSPDSGPREHPGMPISAPETRRMNFTAAVDAAGGVEPFCRQFEMNPDYVRQLLRGGGQASGRNIGNRAARTIEAKLGLTPNQLDQQPIGARVAETVAVYKASVAPSPAQLTRRMENDIDALRYALGALMTGLALTQPGVAAAVEVALKEAPEKFQDTGLLPGLLEALHAGQKASKAAAKPAVRPRVKPRPA